MEVKGRLVIHNRLRHSGDEGKILKRHDYLRQFEIENLGEDMTTWEDICRLKGNYIPTWEDNWKLQGEDMITLEDSWRLKRETFDTT